MLSVLHLKVIFLGDMKCKVFFHYSFYCTDIWTSWDYTDPYCKFAFMFCVNRTEDIPTGGCPGATFVYVGLQVVT